MDIIYGTGDTTEAEFMLEYRKECIMGGDNIPRYPPIWACVCGCKRFCKINPDGTDASHITDAEFRRRRRGWNQAFMTER